jgi:Ca2+-binding EF-hand superfamily protein
MDTLHLWDFVSILHTTALACGKALLIMALALKPEFGIEIPLNMPYMDLRKRAEAACKTLQQLQEHGLDIEPTDEDNEVATLLVTAYAKDAEKTSKTVSNANVAQLTPASLVQTAAILREFGQIVATHAAEIRNTVVNKLILETENPDARVRVKALELLGRMTEVGLFTERKEITVTHQTSDELREKLREKLQTLKKNSQGVYEVAEFVEAETEEEESGDETSDEEADTLI